MIDQLKLGRGGFGLGSLTLPPGKGVLRPPIGFVFVIDADGAYLTDADGYYLVEPV